MTILTPRKYSYLLVASILSYALIGCSQTADSQQVQKAPSSPSSALGNVELHTHQLANELFARYRGNRNARYAVVGFVPVDTLQYDGNQQHPLMLLGHQLEQGLMTEAARRGYTTQEFKISNDIMINTTSDRVLTRDVEKLPGLEAIDFYITGTLVYQQEGAVVNARIIDARNKEVVAAATRFFPAELFWQREQMTSRNGKLYRTSPEL
ncbi:FlgO family outer membrane protein [Alteromonas sp. ASW11-36]|uniref:FlgO family outer membrane protein n=1 Tax=Alteromonas arenosi TaxID=3055817 RepID=A0ABT7SVU4_9ALTE|nr:FlgO family outer membrane protein [Alteromonas sp. ASW11-36]MDM7860319.1 FlgO family outer membrane protein [Alteromonas sp. ASW11-36]